MGDRDIAQDVLDLALGERHWLAMRLRAATRTLAIEQRATYLVETGLLIAPASRKSAPAYVTAFAAGSSRPSQNNSFREFGAVRSQRGRIDLLKNIDEGSHEEEY